jgi:hypothetical protein
MTLVIPPVPPDSDRLPWERQVGEPARAFEAFRAFISLPPAERTLRKPPSWFTRAAPR